MQKRLVLFVLLLCSVASAQELYDRAYDSTYPAVSSDQVGQTSIQRFSDFPLDNIHILRLQEASMALGSNVSLVRQDLKNYQVEQSRTQLEQGRELSQLRNSFDTFERSVLAQLGSMQNSLTDIKADIDRPDLQVPASTFPPYVIILLGLNVFLLVLVIILIFWLREQYYVHRETHTNEHIHPAPKELIEFVKHQLSHDKKLPDIRMELAGKGWTPSIIEHALHAAREK